MADATPSRALRSAVGPPRQAATADAQALCHLLQGRPMGELGGLRAALASPAYALWVFDDESGVCALLWLNVSDKHAIDVLELCVAAHCRRRGLAQRLLRHARAEASGSAPPGFVLEVAADNRPAQALYAKLGFVPVGRRVNYYKTAQGLVDALVLRWP